MHSNNCNDCIAITSLITNARCDPWFHVAIKAESWPPATAHLSILCPTNTIPTPWISDLDSHISEHCMIYIWNMNYATFFLHRRSPKDRCPAQLIPPVLPVLLQGIVQITKKYGQPTIWWSPLVLPGVAFPTRWKTNDGQTGRNGCWQEICYWSPTWGNHPIFDVSYIEYLIIDILTIRH